MFGIDERVAAQTPGAALALVLVIAVVLGLRHATDPDHLTAVSALMASGDHRSRGGAARLGLSWGAGHATTLILFGLPIVFFNSYLPEGGQRAAEVLVGAVIMLLAIRLLRRWRHERLHGGHCDVAPSRTRRQAYAIGLVHGIGGSAGVGILLLAAIPEHARGALALVVFACATAVSMAVASTTLGALLARPALLRHLRGGTPVLGFLSLGFGAWYALGALGTVPYPL